ncbi:glycosyltransferase [Lusitaniella coriacea]|uniref:glycosyltransferase n=1 Tax=Lusitaniella coriacea TaxID=1983105 RepID=UPI003CEF9DB8
MKVLQVIPSLSPALGGPTQVALNLTKALQDCGVVAEIVTTNDNGKILLDVPLNRRVEYEGVPVWFLPRFSPPLKEFLFAPTMAQWLWKNIGNYDILDNHYLFSYASTCAGAIARWQNIPYTVRTMGQLSPWALAQSQKRKKLYSFLIERRNLNSATAIHCTSPGEVRDVRNFGIQTPAITLPLGVNSSSRLPDAREKVRHLYGIETEAPIILFLSRLHPKKRPELLLESLQEVAIGQDFHLIFAGSGEADYVAKIEQQVAHLGLESRTTFAGFVMGIEKDLLLQGSDLFVLPSHAENFAIAVAEAMAQGLPVIVTPGVQIAPEIAREKAGLVVEGNQENLSTAILQLLASPSLRTELGENGKRLVQNRYSWRAIASDLIEAYQAIVDRQPLKNF